jgi:hypothetical protein
MLAPYRRERMGKLIVVTYGGMHTRAAPEGIVARYCTCTMSMTFIQVRPLAHVESEKVN